MGNPPLGADCAGAGQPFSEEIFTNIQFKSLLAQLEAISLFWNICYRGEQTNAHLTAASCQGVVESEKAPLECPLLQTESSQLLLIRFVLQHTLPQLHSLPWITSSMQCLSCEGPKSENKIWSAASSVLENYSVKLEAVSQQPLFLYIFLLFISSINSVEELSVLIASQDLVLEI